MLARTDTTTGGTPVPTPPLGPARRGVFRLALAWFAHAARWPRTGVNPRLLTLALALFSALGTGAFGQEPPSRRPDPNRLPAAADYARAERFLAAAVMPLVIGGTVVPNW